MANHKSSVKRNRANDAKRIRNKYFVKTARTAIKSIRTATDKKAAEAQLPKIASMLDKLAKKNVIHKNKAANIKSKLAKHVSLIGGTTTAKAPKAAKTAKAPKVAAKKTTK